MWSRLSNPNTSIRRSGKAGAAPSPSFHSTWPTNQAKCLFELFSLWLIGISPLSALAQPSETVKPIQATISPQEAAARILQKSIWDSVWGPPTYCIVRQSVGMYGKEFNGQGHYVREGQGSGKLKYDLRMAAGNQINTLLQVSDGQRLLSIESIGDVRRRTEVDLGKVRDPDRLPLTDASYRDPVVAMYLAIGGQAELLRKIYQQYEWISVRDGHLGEIDVWLLSGKVPPQPIAVRSVAPVDNMLFADNNSGLLPTRIEVKIGKDNAPVPFWLYEVEQGRSAEEISPIGRDSKLRIFTEWANPKLLAKEQLPLNIFELPPSNEQLFDETEKYLPPAPSMATAPQIEIVR